MKYFSEKGENFKNINIFDRDGFLTQDVQKELNNVYINGYPANSDLVRCYYTIKIWNMSPNMTHQQIYGKI